MEKMQKGTTKNGSLTTKVVRNHVKSNDGQMIPTGMAAAKKAGFLNVDTALSNTEAFERDYQGGAPQNGAIEGMHSWQPGVNLDDPGLDANGGCFHKWGTPYGETAMFNQLPPGVDINDQAYALIHDMPLVLYTGGVTYKSDTPWPVKDIEE